MSSQIGSSDFDRSFGRLLHVDDDDRFDAWISWLKSSRPPVLEPLSSRNGRLQLMLFAALGQRRTAVASMAYVFERLWRDDARRQELHDLLELLRDRARASTRPIRDLNVPLDTHGTYGLYEVVAAYGLLGREGILRDTREGTLRIDGARTDAFFVTLEKAEAEYSPTTRYEDYPISPTLFHWESQSTTSSDSPTGQRYINHSARGEQVMLFVRARKRDARDETLPYTCLGYATYLRHESSRPMRVVWELERAMPAGFYQEAKVAAG